MRAGLRDVEAVSGLPCQTLKGAKDLRIQHDGLEGSEGLERVGLRGWDTVDDKYPALP